MPLITIMGPPSSGKSSFAQYLQNYVWSQKHSDIFTIYGASCSERSDEQKISPLVISMNQLSANVTSLYDTAPHEKKTRSILKSRIMQHLSQKRILINDSLNEIKGFRFELFRFCQEMGTRHIVVEMRRDLKECLANNEKDRVLVSSCDAINASEETKEDNATLPPQQKQQPWDKNLLSQMINRMEWANGNNRWDKPLFVLADQWESESDRDKQFEAVCESIWHALHNEKISNAQRQPSHIAKDLSDTNMLYEVERATNRVVKKIMELQSTSMAGDAIQVCQESKEKFVYPRRGVSLMQLRRLRQQFIKMQQTTNLKDVGTIYQLFIIYLNNTYK
uniref:Uncharacterized protein n=1 Tax=Percolomonas cosmopolitus TaxID=63605 RepID=A0A7S1KN60_9EUKA